MVLTRLAVLLSVASTSLAQTCYWPAGSVAPKLLACGTTGADSNNSACCFAGDYCLSNGLCFETLGMTMYRAGCTDRYFKSPSCATYCYGTSPFFGVSVGDSHSGVWACGEARYACNMPSCPVSNFTVPAAKLIGNAALRADVTNLGVTTTVTPTLPPTVAPTCSAAQAAVAAEKQCSEGISTGSAVGIGVGVGAPLAIAAATLLILLMRRRDMEKLRLEALARQVPPAQSEWSAGYYAALKTFQIQEGGNGTPRMEMMGTPRHELSM